VGYVQLRKWTLPNLSAPHWRWYFHDEAGASLYMDKKRLPLTPGKVFLIPPHTPFSSHTTRPVDHLYMHFSGALPYSVMGTEIFRHTPGPSELESIRRLQTLLKKGGDHFDWEVSILTHTLVNLALDSVPRRLLVHPVREPRIDRALALIREHYPRAVPNCELARQVNLSTGAFIRLFQKILQLTPHRYLLNLRIEEACQLIHLPHMDIEQIAEKTGFCDRFHFTRVFKQRLKINPSSFRHQAILLSTA
jgi:AraC-like DNA-binding protein